MIPTLSASLAFLTLAALADSLAGLDATAALTSVAALVVAVGLGACLACRVRVYPVVSAPDAPTRTY